MSEATELIGKGLDTFDDVVYSRGEEETDKTSRHLVDMTSDNPFAKIIRPLLATIVTSVWAYKEVLSTFKEGVDTQTVTSVMLVVLSFYFVVRSVEKIQSRKAAASIQQQKIKTHHELREERRDNRKERKE